MHEDYEEDDYEEDDYDYDHPSLNPHNAWYYKFDIGPDTPLSKWLNDIVKDFMGSGENFKITNISGFPNNMFPVNSWNPNTANNKFQYLGSNYKKEPIWKSKYWVIDPINHMYINHIQSHAAYFLQQPSFYKGLFDVLN
jgi:hypothetical protein